MSNAFDKASLVMLPHAYEEGKVYSLKPTDRSGDFTFSRGTDTATRVNEQGYIEKGYENTLLQSNNWAQSDSQYEITGGEAGYDGTNDAWLVNKLAAAYFSINSLVLTGVQTISFFAKAGSLDRILVFIGGDAARFDLTNGTAVEAGGNPVSQNIELVSGTTDWYRCSITINKSATTNLLFKPQNSLNQDVVGTIYIQDAMLNQGLVAYPYLETTTAPVYGGITDDIPRLDYSGGATCPSLLLEPSRTNLIDNSEYITSVNNASISYNATESPEGLLNAPIFTATSGDLFVRSSTFAISTGTSYSISFYIKAFGTAVGKVSTTSVNDTASDSFTLTDSWQRITYTGTATNTITNAQLRIDAPNVGGVTGEQVAIYGLQVEQGSYPTSYIPTYGVSQTRLEDDAINSQVITGARTYFIDGVRANNHFSSTGFFSSNATELRISFWTNNEIRIRAGGSLFPALIGDNFKIAVSFDGISSNRVFMNGVFIGETTFAFTSTYENRITGKFEAWKNNQTIIFPTALSDSECISLTTV